MNNKEFTLILFDLEGTLVDFQWQLDNAVKETIPVLKSFSIDPDIFGSSPSYAKLYNETRKVTQGMDKSIAERLFLKLDSVYEKYDLDALSRWTPYPGTAETLSLLNEKGYRMGVVSNCGSQAVNKVLERFDLALYFKIVLSRDDVSYLKPHKEGLVKALEKLDVPADKALFIGDSLNDILAADNVPMKSCFLNCGESTVTGEEKTGAEYNISSIVELNSFL